MWLATIEASYWTDNCSVISPFGSSHTMDRMVVLGPFISIFSMYNDPDEYSCKYNLSPEIYLISSYVITH